jgi:hypothetical protein
VVIELRSPEKTAVLRMEIISTGAPAYPSVEVQVDLQVQRFAGRESVSLDHDALMKFSHSLVGDSARRVALTVSGGFELDPGTLPAVVEEFQRLERAAESTAHY